MKTENPAITVLMPVYNAEIFIREAIDSILNQTFSDFEFLIFNDGSTDRTEEIIKNYHDDRIRFFSSKRNIGYLHHLNDGIKIAKGKYIARMDSDDIAYINRFETQFKYLEQNPDVGVCGSYSNLFGSAKGLSKNPIEHDEILAQLPFGNAFIHPSVMIRKSVLSDNNLLYNNEFYKSEDYELWVKLSKIAKLHNIPKALLKYRVHENQVSQLCSEDQKDNVKRIYSLLFKEINIELSDEEFEIHYNLNLANPKFSLIVVENWLEKLYRANMEFKYFPEPYFSNNLTEKWLYFNLYNFMFGNIAKKTCKNLFKKNLYEFKKVRLSLSNLIHSSNLLRLKKILLKQILN